MAIVGTAFSADFTELAGVIAAFEERGKNLGKLMPVVAETLRAAVDDVYDAQGPNWEPLAESTVERRRKGKGSGADKILQDTGVMAASTTAKYDANSAEVWARVGYAKYHAAGTSRMPQRNPFDLGPFEADVLADIADLFVQEMIK